MPRANDAVASSARGVRRPARDHRRRRVPGPDVREGRPRRRRPPRRRVRASMPRRCSRSRASASPSPRRSSSTSQTGQIAAVEKLRAEDPGRRAGDDRRARARAEEGDGALRASWASPRSPDSRRRSTRAGWPGCAGSAPKTAENLLHGIELARGADRPGADRRRDGAWPRRSSRRCRPYPGASGARTPARCAGCGRPSATSTSSPPPTTRRPLMAAFAELPLVAEVIVRGDKKTSVRTTAACRSTCGWCRWSRGARPCSTSPAPSSTTCGSGRSPSGKG